MQPSANYLAFDLGASGGRAMVARFDGARFDLSEVHRFENGPVQVGHGLFWHVARLFAEVKTGLWRCAQQADNLRAVGIDTWGVDFGLLAADGDLLAMPRHYRDPRNQPAMEQALERVNRRRIYESTGIQFMPLNTLYQLFAAASAPDRLLESAERLLFMPDLLTYWLTGEAQSERTIASTSQIMNARTGAWDIDLLAALDLPAEIMPPIRQTGTIAGRLVDRVGMEVGIDDLPVVLTASHDTAAAVAAVPATGSDWAYISSGTWSLVGVELTSPLINADALAANFTNEAGVAGTVRFLKNVAGLWLLQECRRCWADAGRAHSYAQLSAAAEKAEPLRSLIDPDDPRLAAPGDMPARIRDACRDLNQPEPRDEAEMIRCILDSLALRYAEVLQTASALAGQEIRTVHLVGGGSQNELLNRLISVAADRLVVVGPVEATALGNVAVQGIALGDLGDLASARAAIKSSVSLRRYEPPAADAERRMWAEARSRFATLSRK